MSEVISLIDLEKSDEDREEGEIVDEFDFILSSEEDEETITKRIKELEARNDELEKIATISGANYPTDVFEISDYEEDYYSKVSSRGQGKSILKSHNQKINHSSENFKNLKHKPVKKRRMKKKKKPPVKPRVIVHPDESASSDSENECIPKVSKDVLRFAVETQNFVAPNKRNLKERLINVVKLKDEDSKKTPPLEVVEMENNEAEVEIEESSSEEQELRIMALKSAIMNRHSDRVKRKKESTAYSPSDFEAVLNQSPIVPEEGTETPNMDISPIASPASIMSDEVQTVDMDIGDSEEEFPITHFHEQLVCSGENNIPKPLPLYQTPDNEEEEEEEALRALLLAKMSSPKVLKTKLQGKNDENQENKKGDVELTAALILKKAVQRLQEKKLVCDIVETPKLPVSEEPPPKPLVLESEEKVLREKPEENQQRPPPPPEKKTIKPAKRKTVPPAPIPVVVKKPKTNLITTVPNHKVKKLVISLHHSEDEEHELCGDIFTKHFLSTNISLDSENYAEAASPSSLLFVENSTSSPSTPRSHSPFVSGTELPAIKKQITNDVFEAKLDTFLKNARNQVEQSAIKEVEAKKTVQGTPMAVRHLPESSRAEYKKLIKRMELLEKQKELGLKKLQQTQQKSKVDTIKITIKNHTPQVPKRIVIKTSGMPASLAQPPSTKLAHVTVPPQTTPQPQPKLPVKPAQTPVNKEELFHKVETQYNKNESLLMENLSKNLVLVETAMISKTRKLELESRLSILVKEMKEIESGLKEENTKINKIYPQIRFLHKTMEDLKSKRTRLYKYANTLGKTVKNGQISLKDSQRKQISAKYKHLATSMKALKALNKDNITLTKDFSTQVELEVDKDEKEDLSTPKKDIEEVHIRTEVEPVLEGEVEEDNSPQQFTLGSETLWKREDDRILNWSNEYISPLNGSCANTSEKLDPNSIICPYALIGHCVDKDCKYNHI